MFKIDKTDLKVVIEPLKMPFGFKGGYTQELWQVVCKVESGDSFGIGIGVQSILWSDQSVYKAYTPKEGNELMVSITKYALSLLDGKSFENPIQALDSIIDDVYAYAKGITKNPNLRKTFALNALVSVDNALWQLMGKLEKSENFLNLLTDDYKEALSNKLDKIVNIPLITYKISPCEIKKLVDDGSFLLKIKIGSDPDGDGDLDKMLSWDKQRINEIHNIVKDIFTPYTDTNHISYYLDANGRYVSIERLNDLLDYCNQIGALDRVLILEEPFDEENKIDVSGVKAIVASDESAHSCEDVIERINLGYRAIALKPIAKTMSETLKILKEAHKSGVNCFCADLTVNPVMVDFNKNIASRIDKYPGVKIGIMESNGKQNYVNWDDMLKAHPMYSKANFIESKNSIYTLDDEFFDISGGIFKDSEYYVNLFK